MQAQGGRMTTCLSRNLQEFEARYRNWLNNLDFVLEYNSKHKSHWVSLRAPAAAQGRYGTATEPPTAPFAAGHERPRGPV